MNKMREHRLQQHITCGAGLRQRHFLWSAHRRRSQRQETGGDTMLIQQDRSSENGRGCAVGSVLFKIRAVLFYTRIGKHSGRARFSAGNARPSSCTAASLRSHPGQGCHLSVASHPRPIGFTLRRRRVFLTPSPQGPRLPGCGPLGTIDDCPFDSEAGTCPSWDSRLTIEPTGEGVRRPRPRSWAHCSLMVRSRNSSRPRSWQRRRTALAHRGAVPKSAQCFFTKHNRVTFILISGSLGAVVQSRYWSIRYS